jgi:TIR domain
MSSRSTTTYRSANALTCNDAPTQYSQYAHSTQDDRHSECPQPHKLGAFCYRKLSDAVGNISSMARCTAPVRGHRSAAAQAACPACGGRSYGRYSYSTPVRRYPSYSSGGSYSAPSPSRSTGRSSSVSYTAAERRTLDPVRREVERQVQLHPERRDLFLCHAWPDREGAAKDLYDSLISLGATVWFSEKDVGLGTSLIREIDKGLSMCKAGIVLVTPALFESIKAAGVAEKELSALLATDRVIPVAHGTTFEALRDVSPLLAARSGLSTQGSSMHDVAVKIADTVHTELVDTP